MKILQKAGGIGAFVLAFSYLFGIGIGVTVLNTDAITDPLERIAYHVEHYRLYYLWISLVYINAGIFLIPLSLGLKERISQFSESAKPLAKLGAFYGIGWAVLILGSGLVHNSGLLQLIQIYPEDPQRAVEFWQVIETVHMGIGAEAEIPGGIWSILVGIAGLKSGAFPRWVNITGITAGVAGLFTIIPALMDSIIAVYALGHIIWWISMGVVMIKGDKVRPIKNR